MQQEISAGHAQQLNKMNPEERINVLAGMEFQQWIKTGGAPMVQDGVQKMRFKMTYTAGFFAGLHRAGSALTKKKRFSSESFFVSAAIGFVVGFLLGSAYLVYAMTLPIGH